MVSFWFSLETSQKRDPPQQKTNVLSIFLVGRGHSLESGLACLEALLPPPHQKEAALN